MGTIGKKRQCKTEGCTNEPPLHSCYCWRCQKKKWYTKYPLKYVFGYLKQNAKRRGIEFRLSLEEFGDFCRETGYLELRGQTKESLSIDRKDPREGYHKKNIQVLTLSENSSKGATIPEEFMPRKSCPF